MHSQRFEEKIRKQDEHQPEGGSIKCERVNWMSLLQNETVPGTCDRQQKGKTFKIDDNN